MIFPTPEKSDEGKKEIKALEDKIESLAAKLKTEEQKETAALKAELDEALKLKRWAHNDIQEVGRLLDMMGAPTVQDNGFPYSIIGRLSALTRSWRAKINILTAEAEAKEAARIQAREEAANG